ncbi:hypothetical protein [Halomarina oriensis]|uniref:Uncharacterized protein n=1 Tax=Halomarina oriensis TaxID=671145 RepID=A0A6B0GRA2_9EURY|nr:hypothetical protein [Halomarina oriensis]MWG36129.1 hypothetical protein [Halomarina oriensis]
MTTHVDSPPRSAVARVASVAADSDLLPLSLRSVLGYYAETGVFDYDSLTLKRYVDRTVEELLTAAYRAVERSIADVVDEPPSAIEFAYDTKLTLPAELTLGRVYQRAVDETPAAFNPVTLSVRTPLVEYVRSPFDDEYERRRLRMYREQYAAVLDEVERAEAMTELVVEALLDGDMRDAINDDEYDDFEVEGPTGDLSTPEIAVVAQETLAARVEAQFETFPDEVRAAYERAVTVSERHQDDDPRFREIAERAATDADAAATDIREEYKHAPFDDDGPLFAPEHGDLPYFTTQYGRVGVIYAGMIEMYRAVGIDIDAGFEESIILAIVGAQIWLDDVDDFPEDLADRQLTPATAEYWLADSDGEAYDRIVDIAVRYLDAAKAAATASDSTLTGIAVEYILRSGAPESLPGSRE